MPPVAVAEDLHLDVARARNEFLDVDIAAAERGLAPRTGSAERRPRFPSRPSTARVPRPPPPATALMIIAPPLSDGEERLRLVQRDGVVEAADHRHISLLPRPPAPGPCRRTGPDAPTSGPTKVRPASAQRRAKSAALGEEAVAGMDGIAARCLGRRDDRVGVQIGRRALARQQLELRRRRADAGCARRPRNERRPWAVPDRPRRGRCGWRSRRDWRSGAFVIFMQLS